MTWQQVSEFITSQKRLIGETPSLIAVAKPGETLRDTFDRLEESTCDALDETVRAFAKTGKWRTFSDEEKVMLYYRLHYGADTASALQECQSGLFPVPENREADILIWLLEEAWGYPGAPRTSAMIADHVGQRDAKKSPDFLNN